jgi:hypothetical protein
MDNSDGMSSAQSSPDESLRRVKDATGQVVERGKQAAADAVSKGAERVSTMADTTASALRRAAEDVEGENRLISKALRKSADSIERAVQSFEGGDLSRAVDDLNGFARRQPALFLGASLALGFALARVGKTAIEQSSDADLSDAAQSPMPGL